MSTLHPQAKQHGDCTDHESYTFQCPGCKDWHEVTVKCSYPGPKWGFNGDMNAPTFTPSLLATSGHYCPGANNLECWCTFEERYQKPKPMEAGCYICHSFITNGQIQFLSDCTHELAGQTVPLP